MCTRLVSCIPLDLHSDVQISELLWSFFSSFVDGCSRWQLPSSPPSPRSGAAQGDDGDDDATTATAFTSFGRVTEGQFHCTPSQCNASTVSHVAAVLAHHPNLALAYDLFCSLVVDAAKIRKYSASLFECISVTAKTFFQLLGCDRKAGP
jgi:hypothetical protein